MIKITKTILWSLLAFVLLSEGNAWAQPSPKEAAAMSVRKLDEALDLLRGIDMHSDIGAAHHYAISDSAVLFLSLLLTKQV